MKVTYHLFSILLFAAISLFPSSELSAERQSKRDDQLKQQLRILLERDSINNELLREYRKALSKTTGDTLFSFFNTQIGDSQVAESGNTTSIKKADSAITSVQEVQQEKIDFSGKESSNWSFFIIAFLAGLAAILTPCVFPMIPMTVSYFTKVTQNGKIKALIYGLSIVLIYTSIGALITIIFGEEAAYIISTHWAPNLLFFAVFFIFGLSFLGLFEIVLPSSLANSADRQADKGGFLGIFFMALTLAIVSFSCTGPIAGSILFGFSNQGVAWRPLIGMLGFSLGFALPFTVFAWAPRLMDGLPKSGSWMNSVKVVFGFLELALALKFLSNPDQTYGWGILNRDVFLALWITIFLMLSLYLLGFIRLPHDSKMEKIPVLRLFLAIITLSFTIYLIPGLFGAPLKLLTGYLPPLTSMEKIRVAGTNGTNYESNAPLEPGDKILYSDKLKLPHDLTGYFDLKQGMEVAAERNMPVLLDFTGKSCVNCRKMEEYVWSEPEVLRRLREDFIIISLYADVNFEMPEDRWYFSERKQDSIKELGDMVRDFQIKKYDLYAQPLYVVVGKKMETLSGPMAYDSNPEVFISFLEKGKKAYRKKYSKP